MAGGAGLVYLNVPRRRSIGPGGTGQGSGRHVQRGYRPVPPLVDQTVGRGSEGDDALDHEALELAAAADVARREGLVVLADELDLREHVRGDEPAAADLVALDRDIVPDPSELTVHRVGAATDIELVAGEPIQPFSCQLPQGPAGLLGHRGARHGLDVPEELCV